MEGTFPDATLGRNLILVLNGDTLNNKNVQFVSKGSSEKPQAVLTLLNTINGEAKTEIVTDLVKATNPDNNELIRLKFEGIYSTKSHSVKYSGYIEPMVLSINLEDKSLIKKLQIRTCEGIAYSFTGVFKLIDVCFNDIYNRMNRIIYFKHILCTINMILLCNVYVMAADTLVVVKGYVYDASNRFAV
jgi:hypothetical protein